METTSFITPLVSVIIPCYNHARFLPAAINSIREQHYPAVEVIVVDDGSVDNTKEVVAGMPGVTYVYQANAGLSAARNTGIKHSKGAYLLFLDADDWLLPNAIATNVAYLQQNDALAFVSGAHIKVFEDGKVVEERSEVAGDHFLHLLQGNYIGMHAAVLYRQKVFQNFLFDETLRNCEDYDLYFKITRSYPVLHHTQLIAAYRIHSANMSANIPAMLKGVLNVLKRQKGMLKNKAERNAYTKGKAIWKEYYCSALIRALQSHKLPPTRNVYRTLLTHKPSYLLNYFTKKQTHMLKRKIRQSAPAFTLRWLHQAGWHKGYLPAVGKITMGDLDRLTPFSREFGYDRGGPVDRYYIEGFLQREAAHIKGRVLEIGDNEYTLTYGASAVTTSDILHVDEKNPQATLIGDLANAPQIRDAIFDCIILTQTLHLIYEYKAALTTCYRILKPGGVLLLTVPGITPIDSGEWKETWYWSFTDSALKKMFSETFPGGTADVQACGNVFAATAFLYGMGLPEVEKEKLDKTDPQYQVIITVKAQKKISL